jgi:hypothetical protein
MGFVISLILIAFGAILTWAVHSTSGTIDVTTVGVILMVVGVIVFVLSITLWHSWWGAGFWGAWYNEGAGPPVVRRRVHRPYASRPYASRRTTYVEEEPSAGP